MIIDKNDCRQQKIIIDKKMQDQTLKNRYNCNQTFIKESNFDIK